MLLIKNLIKENQIFGLKIIILLLTLIKETFWKFYENFDSDDEKEREDMFKKHIFKIFWCNPNDPEIDLFTFLDEISLYISTLRKEAANEMINKITEDFEKLVAVTKSKELKRYSKNIWPNYKKG